MEREESVMKEEKIAQEEAERFSKEAAGNAIQETEKLQELEKPRKPEKPVAGGHIENVEREDGSWEILEYDNAGRKVRTIYYRADGNLYYWMAHEYSSDGRLMKNIQYASSDGKVLGVYKYDDAGMLVEMIAYDSDGNIWTWYVYEYDDSGNRTRSIQYSRDGLICGKDEYEYDSKGKRVKWTSSDGEGNVYGWIEYEYDSAGNRIKESSFFSNGTVSSIDEYDGKENKIKSIAYNEDGTLFFWTEYDSNGKTVKYVVYNADGSREEADHDNGELKSITYYDAAGNTTGWHDFINNIYYNADGSVKKE